MPSLTEKAPTPTDTKSYKTIVSSKEPFFDFPYLSIWKNKHLLYVLFRQQVVRKMKQTILGPLWVVLQPMLGTLAFIAIFTKLLHVEIGKTPPILFYLLGNIMWTYFSTCTLAVARTFLDNSGMLKKVNLSKQLLAISVTFGFLLNLILQMCVFIGFYCYYWYHGIVFPNAWVLTFPLIVFVSTLLSLGLGYVMAYSIVKYKDLNAVYQYFFQFLLYATPVIYPYYLLTDFKKTLLSLNPLTGLFEVARYGFFSEGVPDLSLLGYAAGMAVFTFILGIHFMSRINKVFADWA